MRKLGHLKGPVVALFVILGVTSQAQKLPTATAPGAYLSVGVTYGGFNEEYPDPGRVLGGVGIYADINVRRHFGIEGEVRWLRQNQIANSNETTYLVGPRFELHRGKYSPYVKGLIGGGKLVFPDFNGYGSGYGTYTAFAFGGGLDVALTEKIKLRAVDFEYQDWPSFYYPGLSQQKITPYGVSAGISYRALHTGGWRKHRYK